MTNDPSSGVSIIDEDISSTGATELDGWTGWCEEVVGMILMLGITVRVMVTGSRKVKYSVLTSSKGVIMV